MPEAKQIRFDTLSLHAGQRPDPVTGARAVPIYQTTSYVFRDSDHAASLFNLEEPGYIYSRIMNPTVAVLEERLAALEGGVGAVCTASGQAALHLAIATLMGAGGHIVAAASLYGGSINMLKLTLPRFGITTSFVDPRDAKAFAAAIRPETRLVFAEILGNPGLEVLDVPAVAEVAHDAGLPLMVDATFATPYLCRTIEHGADIVVHSATKYIGGHSDLIGGVACTTREMRGQLRALAIDVGGAMQPLDAWLAIRGLVTLELRMRRHSESAQRVAEFLERHPKVERVSYPGLASHPHHEIAGRELRRGFGGMAAFEVEGGVDPAVRFCDALELAWVATSLGGHHTLVGHAASTTHRQMDPEARRAAGIGDGLIRVSVGLEDPDDILEDFDRALEKA
jgi:O-acetylhomoserine (thiol)-lyase